ncbi:hypothetical protein [Stutzerimonas stutzeri]|uniref:hypothetical protein n=1 Tax=Stutzerimonas stutzeri TaxID=316 RepID=UPI002553F545|nr:hypothetical protein [Stutzerimonas stutzeri]
MRAGTETALARVVAVFGAAKPHCAYLFANRRANRMKVLVHERLLNLGNLGVDLRIALVAGNAVPTEEHQSPGRPAFAHLLQANQLIFEPHAVIGCDAVKGRGQLFGHPFDSSDSCGGSLDDEAESLGNASTKYLCSFYGRRIGQNVRHFHDRRRGVRGRAACLIHLADELGK